MSVTYLAPCSHCYQDRAEFETREKEFHKLASYKTKKGIPESMYHILRGFGYKEIYLQDKDRPLYSCDECYVEYGCAIPELWEHSEKGFLRHMELKRRQGL